DDFTGASDQAGMLARAGASSLLILSDRYPVDPTDWDAITYATRLRSIPVPEARRQARRLLKRAQSLQPRMVQYKYCSTFDSTPEGNIGPILDVALDLFNLRGAIVVPALPVNGRTTYQGHHFVHGLPLNESPMRHHPLNPMTDSSLLRWLRQQTPRPIALIPYETVQRGPKAIRRQLEALWATNQQYVVIDCLDQRHVRAIARAVSDLPFISGSSALAMELPTIWSSRVLGGAEPQPAQAVPTRSRTSPPLLALSGSCAAQTLRQLDHADTFTIIRPDLSALLSATPTRVAQALWPDVTAAFRTTTRVLVATSQPAAERLACPDAREFGLRIEHFLGALARLAVRRGGLRHLLVAGGETSGAVCQALGLGAVEILRELAPGVPLCRALPDRDLVIALKGGNFGPDDFFNTAATAAQQVWPSTLQGATRQC
ncbi:MAG: four-carbon acid sugar kinase family protein, partial [Armatimonadia bacterium]